MHLYTTAAAPPTSGGRGRRRRRRGSATPLLHCLLNVHLYCITRPWAQEALERSVAALSERRIAWKAELIERRAVLVANRAEEKAVTAGAHTRPLLSSI